MQVDELIGQLQQYAASTKRKEAGDESLREVARQVADELVALQSIFGNENVALLPAQNNHASSNRSSEWRPEDSIRLSVTVPIDLGDDEVLIKLSATLPSGYPQSPTPPQLQLLSRYIGPHGVDHSLFGQILRIFYQSADAEEHDIFQPGEVCLFDGIEHVREKVEGWYSEREAERLQRRQEDKSHGTIEQKAVHEEQDEAITLQEPGKTVDVVKDYTIFSSPAITERKSVFVGHAAVLKDVSQVALILDDITKDKKIARASHPTIYAWVCRPGAEGAVYRGCNDDGETAAGGRLAHLLDLLHLENVIVVVTRWYGGVHLGADRFKMINRAARDALEIAQLVSGPLNTASESNSVIKRQ